MSTRLEVYQRALQILGERRLSGLTEARPPRYWLDDAWTPALKFIAGDYDWLWCRVYQKLESDPEIEPVWGFRKVQNKPGDFLRLSGIWSDDYQRAPIRYYQQDADNWYTDYDEIYVAYVPNTTETLVASWPETYAEFVSYELAKRIHGNVSDFSEYDMLRREYKRAKTDARSDDTNQGPPAELPTGSWVRAVWSGNRTTGPKGYNY